MTEAVLQEREQSHLVHFDLDGKFFADLARTRVEEGNWRDALRMLCEGLEGLSHEQAVALLKGEADLDGRSSQEPGIGFVELGAEHPLAQHMRGRLDWLYGNVFRHNGQHWKPYARVTSWGREDYEFALGARRSTAKLLDTTSRSNSSRHIPQLDYRSLFYADQPAADLLVVVQLSATEQAEILCERVDMPPLWIGTPRCTIDEHLRQRLRQGQLSLDLRGCLANGFDDSAVQRDPSEVPPQAASVPMETGEAPDCAASEVRRVTVNEALAMVQAHRQRRTLIDDFTQRMTAVQTPEELGALSRRFDREVAALEREVRCSDEETEERYRLLDAAEAARLKLLGERVRDQARRHGGFFQLALTGKDGKPCAERRSIEVPRHPFVLWALRGFDFEAHGKTRPEWPVVSDSGLKMAGDNPYHTDWMLGAGLRLAQTYAEAEEDGSEPLEALVRRGSFDERMRLIEEWTGAKFAILAKGPHTLLSGDVVHARPNQPVPAGSVAVCPSAGPEYQLAMESACRPDAFGQPGFLICETGGKLAHLAIVGRENGCTVLMVPGALAMYQPGARVSVDFQSGKLQLQL